MLARNTKNLVYFSGKDKKSKSKSNNNLSNKQINHIFEILSKYAMKEKSPDFEELESLLQSSLNTEDNEELERRPQIDKQNDEISSITKFLQEKGYLCDKKKWLTHKGFFQVGNKILHDVMNELKSSEFGLHSTNFYGNGNVIMDTTKKFEPGSDIKFLSASQTIFNTIQRILKNNKSVNFPISVEPNDLEEFETLEDVRVAIVYCIDLSSTMKSLLGKNGKSRIEAAKKALWSLYILNKKFFPTDSIHIVGFASMASIVNPYDIPFLKTYDTNDNFLHYTNYQAALRLARKILGKNSAQNKRIILITDGQPSACFVDNEYQKNQIISEKPYSNFYSPDNAIISKIQQERNLSLDAEKGRLVYLCYRYKKVDPKIEERTLLEAKKCIRDGIEINSIVVSDESELLSYIQEFEKTLKGKSYHIKDENMDKVLVNDYIFNTRKILRSKQNL